MIRAVLYSCIFALFTLPATAQDPVVELAIEEDTAIVGQPITMRLSVLVPTFMPSPPVFPAFEAAELMVRLNGRATNPTSKTIEGETWEGVIRKYSFYPLIAGQFNIPPQSVTITLKDANNNDLTTTVDTPAFTLTGAIPEGAEALDPLIVAEDITLEQEITVPQNALATGDAITRSLKIQITGAPAMFLPPVLDEENAAGFRGYAQDSKLAESLDRGTLSGTRTEEISYIATQTGKAELPPLSLSWYNLKTKTIETTGLDGKTFNIIAGPSESAGFNAVALLKIGGALALVVVTSILFVKFAVPPLKQAAARRKVLWLESEEYAFQTLKTAIAGQDLNATLGALSRWQSKSHNFAESDAAVLENALLKVSAPYFGEHANQSSDKNRGWPELARAADATRRALRVTSKSDVLPPLNPFRISAARD